MKTTPEFEAVIADEIGTHYRGRRLCPNTPVEYLTARGVDIAQDYLLAKAEGFMNVQGVIKRAKRLNTLREIAFNLNQPATARLSDGSKAW